MAQFIDSKERERMLASMRALLVMPEWGVLVKVLQDQLNSYLKDLETGEFKTKEEFQRLQDKILMQRQLMSAPEGVVRFLEDTNQPLADFDPFPQQKVDEGVETLDSADPY